VLANLVLRKNAFPEFLQEDCTPESLSAALELLLKDTPERRAQLAALARIPERLQIEDGTPSGLAAEIVLHYAERGRQETF
jgi:lipid-A-disaccharide synthase